MIIKMELSMGLIKSGAGDVHRVFPMTKQNTHIGGLKRQEEVKNWAFPWLSKTLTGFQQTLGPQTVQFGLDHALRQSPSPLKGKPHFCLWLLPEDICIPVTSKTYTFDYFSCLPTGPIFSSINWLSKHRLRNEQVQWHQMAEAIPKKWQNWQQKKNIRWPFVWLGHFCHIQN